MCWLWNLYLSSLTQEFLCCICRKLFQAKKGFIALHFLNLSLFYSIVWCSIFKCYWELAWAVQWDLVSGSVSLPIMSWWPCSWHVYPKRQSKVSVSVSLSLFVWKVSNSPLVLWHRHHKGRLTPVRSGQIQSGGLFQSSDVFFTFPGSRL